MSTNTDTPVPLKLLLLGGVAVVAAIIASNLLGYLETTSAGSSQLGWWVPLLSIAMPTLVFLGIFAWLYLSGSGR